MHIIGQYKRLSLAREEGDPTKWDAGSGSGLFRHKLSPGHRSFLTHCLNMYIFILISAEREDQRKACPRIWIQLSWALMEKTKKLQR